MSATSPQDTRIPVTILTGFLGAGKTTLLNRILNENHGKRIAVIENEYGEIGIDNALVINAEEEIFEMNNGCICCTVRGDLIRILGSLMKRKDKFDAILVETTGLADPSPVAQTFFVDDELRDQLRLDGIITLVDAKHIALHLNDSHECQEQIAFADVLLLNKVDLVEESQLGKLETRLRAMNAMARIYHTKGAEIALDKVLNVGGFDLNRAIQMQPKFLKSEKDEHGHHHHHHEHETDISSVGIECVGELDGACFHQWLSKLLKEKGQDIYRMKGIIAVQGEDCRFVFQGVHMLYDGQPDRPWGESPRLNQLVFIGKHLNRAELTDGFKQCLSDCKLLV